MTKRSEGAPPRKRLSVTRLDVTVDLTGNAGKHLGRLAGKHLRRLDRDPLPTDPRACCRKSISQLLRALLDLLAACPGLCFQRLSAPIVFAVDGLAERADQLGLLAAQPALQATQPFLGEVK